MKRVLYTYVLVATLYHFAGREGITYGLREQLRIWWLAWITAGEEARA